MHMRAIGDVANGDVPDFAHFNTTSTCKKRHVPNSTSNAMDKPLSKNLSGEKVFVVRIKDDA